MKKTLGIVQLIIIYTLLYSCKFDNIIISHNVIYFINNHHHRSVPYINRNDPEKLIINGFNAKRYDDIIRLNEGDGIILITYTNFHEDSMISLSYYNREGILIRRTPPYYGSITKSPNNLYFAIMEAFGACDYTGRFILYNNHLMLLKEDYVEKGCSIGNITFLNNNKLLVFTVINSKCICYLYNTNGDKIAEINSDKLCKSRLMILNYDDYILLIDSGTMINDILTTSIYIYDIKGNFIASSEIEGKIITDNNIENRIKYRPSIRCFEIVDSLGVIHTIIIK